MRIILLPVLMGLLFCFNALAQNQISSASGNYCIDEVNHYFEQKFGDELEITEIKFSGNGYNDMDTSFEYWIRVKQCDDYFIARFPPRYGFCKVANTSKAKKTSYMRSVEATKSCKKFLPKSEKLKVRWR